MPVLKPIRGIRLNKSHPLARGLVGYWLLNEGSGTKVFDLSWNGNTGTRNGTGTVWTPGKFGSAQQFNGSDDYVDIGDITTFDGATSLTIITSVKFSSIAVNDNIVRKWYASGKSFMFSIDGTISDEVQMAINDSSSNVLLTETTDANLVIDVWYHFAIVWSGGNDGQIYVDAVAKTMSVTTAQTPTDINNSNERLTFGNRYNNGSPDLFFDGIIDYVMIYNRALSASEIALLYREPFRMFDRASSNLRFQISNFKLLEGTAAGTSDVSAVLGLRRGLTASTGGSAAVDGSLSVIRLGGHEIQRNWLREALFNGMTANAFKLGTSLTSGWFWVRVTGCSVLYRGQAGGVGGVDFANILTVSEYGTLTISPPNYIPHDGGANGTSTYFYVVRRFNNCGYQELTLAAAVKVSIGISGELAEPQPNGIYRISRVEQVDSNKVRLTWFYWPCQQGSRPVLFNVYYDNRTGQIDYENPLNTTVIEYKGRRFYSFQSSALGAGEEGDEHLFAIRAEDAAGIENTSLAQLKIQLGTLSPNAIDILSAEAV